MSERKNKGWNNLRGAENSFALYDKEKLREVSRKGALAAAKVKREKRNARESMEKILNLGLTDELINAAKLPDELAERLRTEFPDASIYDLVQMIAVGNALGNADMRAVEYIRDTCGDKPSNKIDMATENTMTESDRLLLEKVSRRLESEDLIIAYDCTNKEE